MPPASSMYEPIDAGARHRPGITSAVAAKSIPDGGIDGEPATRCGKVF